MRPHRRPIHRLDLRRLTVRQLVRFERLSRRFKAAPRNGAGGRDLYRTGIFTPELDELLDLIDRAARYDAPSDN